MNRELLNQFSTNELLENRNRLLLAIEDLEYLLNELQEEKDYLSAKKDANKEPEEESFADKAKNAAQGALTSIKNIFARKKVKDHLFG